MILRITSVISLLILAFACSSLCGSGDRRPTLVIDAEGPISAMAVSPDGKTIVSGTARGKPNGESIVFWDAVTGKKRYQVDAHARSVSQVTFSFDGRLLATASFDNTVKVWDLSADKPRLLTTIPLDWALDMRFLKDKGKMLAQSVAEPPVLVNYENKSKVEMAGKLSIERKASCSRFALSSSLKLAALATGWLDRPNVIVLREIPSGQELRQLAGRQNVILSVDFSPNGNYLAVGYMHADRGHELVEIKLLKNDETTGMSGHKSPVHSLAFTQDGALLASGDNSGMIILWDVVRKLKLDVIKAHSQQVTSLAFMANSYCLVSASHDGSIKTWNLKGKLANQK